MILELIARDCCACPVLNRWPDGTLGVIFLDQPSHGLTTGNLAALVSRDAGHSWVPAGLAAPHGPATNRMHIASGLDHSGRWLVLSTGFRFEGAQWTDMTPLWLSHAAQPGTAWSIDRSIRVATEEPFLIPHGRIHALPDGRLLANFYRAESRQGPSHAWLGFSRDGGISWSDLRQIGDNDTNEVVLLPRCSDAWFAIARTQQDHHLVFWRSSDEGLSWEAPLPVTPAMVHPGDLTLLADGRLLLTYGIRLKGKTAIGFRHSRDTGRTWSPPEMLLPLPAAADCGYPSSVQLDDATLLTAFYSDRSSLHNGYQLLTAKWTVPDPG